jgi:ATP-dependent helicase C-terminal
VQELFGVTQHPSIARGKLVLTLHLLSPAHRPIQITRDLPGFWKGSWAAVKTEMKGRYPRHSWPDDPASATPTTRAKPRRTWWNAGDLRQSWDCLGKARMVTSLSRKRMRISLGLGWCHWAALPRSFAGTAEFDAKKLRTEIPGWPYVE